MNNEGGGNSPELSVLVPVYNNAATLHEFLDRVRAVLEPRGVAYEIVLVDDGSTDVSLSILRARAGDDARIRVFALTRNFGSQAASCAAFELARGRRFVHLDADLENLPEDIPPILDYLDRGYDLVCGAREQRHAPWLTRRLPSMLMNVYVRRRTGFDIRDVGSGFRGMDAGLVRDLGAEGELRRMLTPLLLRRARRVIEVPVRSRPTAQRGGHSFLSVFGIATDYFLATARRPFLVTGLISASTVALGILGLAVVRPRNALTLVALGLLGALLSLIGEYVQRIYQLVQGVPFYTLRDLDAEAAAPPPTRPAESGTGHE